MNKRDYPFAQELITDTQGNVLKVIIDFRDYENLLTTIEDEALYRAMMSVKDEIALSKDAALAELDRD